LGLAVYGGDGITDLDAINIFDVDGITVFVTPVYNNDGMAGLTDGKLQDLVFLT
jgi:hypothetical protein